LAPWLGSDGGTQETNPKPNEVPQWTGSTER